jgi:hypothetical protein
VAASACRLEVGWVSQVDSIASQVKVEAIGETCKGLHKVMSSIIPAKKTFKLKLPGDPLRQQADEETEPDMEGGMIGDDEACRTDQPCRKQDDGEIETGSIVIGKGEQKKEHERAAHSDGMHADLEPDIAKPGAADRQEGPQQEMNGHLRNIWQVPEDIPGPKVKDHSDQVGNDPFLFRTEENGLNEFQPPQQKDGKSGQKNITEYDIDEPEKFQLSIEIGKGNRMHEDQEGHHIAADKKRMKYIG